ncbi:hypothetical protein GLE_2538 [Lysobacter enzymogenes]|uniref:Uncharacterized protein n=1 Tax=Lysobacter enzymogenes TaxID=69 RepID=A0A0S2DHW2_LYSEN|nr:hypothetical protein GLE_2538 [Lysobacter enzymogenes]
MALRLMPQLPVQLQHRSAMAARLRVVTVHAIPTRVAGYGRPL